MNTMTMTNNEGRLYLYFLKYLIPVFLFQLEATQRELNDISILESYFKTILQRKTLKLKRKQQRERKSDKCPYFL